MHNGQIVKVSSLPRSPHSVYDESNPQGEDGQQEYLGVQLKWDSPYAGEGLDVYELVEPDVLHVHSIIKLQDGGQVFNRAIFKRKR